MTLQTISIISSLKNLLQLLMSGRLKISSSQDIRSSLSENYLLRLPQLTNEDVVIEINGTHLIFHKGGGMSISNKYNIISSEALIADHREGYCEALQCITKFEEPDENLQPRVLLSNGELSMNNIPDIPLTLEQQTPLLETLPE